MTWLYIAAGAWLLIAVVAALVIARAIKVADDRQREIDHRNAAEEAPIHVAKDCLPVPVTRRDSGEPARRHAPRQGTRLNVVREPVPSTERRPRSRPAVS